MLTYVQDEVCYFPDSQHKAPSYPVAVDPCQSSWFPHILVDMAWSISIKLHGLEVLQCSR